jgi:hypothetical protein
VNPLNQLQYHLLYLQQIIRDVSDESIPQCSQAVYGGVISVESVQRDPARGPRFAKRIFIKDIQKNAEDESLSLIFDVKTLTV